MLVRDCFAPVPPPVVGVGTVLRQYSDNSVWAIVTTGWTTHEISLVVWDGNRIRVQGKSIRNGLSSCSNPRTPPLTEQECRDLDIMHWTIVPPAEVPPDIRMRLL